MKNATVSGMTNPTFSHENSHCNNLSTTSKNILQNKQLNILIIDDHRLFADGICSLLNNYDQNLCTQFAHNITTASEVITDSYKPDLILLGINNAVMDSNYAFIEELNHKRIFIPVMILSASDTASAAGLAIENNASGFISKNCSRKNILEAILSVLNGNIYISKPKQRNHENEIQQGAEKITKRQQQVLCLLSKGLLNKQIAWELEISENTVKAHLSDLFRHLHVSNRTAAVKYGYEYGLLV